VVAIFGPTVKEFGFFPFRARSRVVEQAVSSRPCSSVGSERCKERHFRCMLDTHPQQVMNAVHELISSE
jgi:heptosyltransferase-2